MQVQQQFRLVLPSNVSANGFHDNTIGKYTTKLHSRLHFDDDWEVALTEISYTFSWYNIPQDCEIYLVNNKNERQTGYTSVVNAGYYNSPNDLVGKINRLLSKIKGVHPLKYPQLKFHPESNKVVPTIGEVENETKLYPSFDRNLMNMLGLRDPNVPTTVSERYAGEFSDFVTMNAQIVLNENNILTFIDKNGVRVGENEIALKKSTYTLRTLMDYINFTCHQIYPDKSPKLIYKPLNKRNPNRVIICQIPGEFDRKKIYLSFSDNLMTLFGFRSASHDINLESFYEHLTPYAADVFAGFRRLHIYSDLVNLSFVGDDIVPLLRTVEVPTSNRFGHQVDLEPKTKIYLPLKKSIVDTIEIDIRDDTGQPVSFEFGRVTATLHFRRK